MEVASFHKASYTSYSTQACINIRENVAEDKDNTEQLVKNEVFSCRLTTLVNSSALHLLALDLYLVLHLRGETLAFWVPDNSAETWKRSECSEVPVVLLAVRSKDRLEA